MMMNNVKHRGTNQKRWKLHSPLFNATIRCDLGIDADAIDNDDISEFDIYLLGLFFRMAAVSTKKEVQSRSMQGGALLSMVWLTRLALALPLSRQRAQLS